MVRKHYPWIRARAKRSRPKTPAPKTGWVISELSQLTELPVRRIRYYVEHGLVRPLEIRGTATRYQRRELLRLLALPSIRTNEMRKLADLKRALDRLGESELEAVVLARTLSPAVRAALKPNAPSAPNLSTPASAAWPWERPSDVSAPSAESPAGRASVDLWHRVQLLPGLELMISANASPAVRTAARRIYEEFVG